MTDSRPDQGDDRRAEQEAPAWHSFGVPYGGAPEPPPYTPAMRERPRGDLTQPIDTSSTQEVQPEARSRAAVATRGVAALVDDPRRRRYGVPRDLRPRGGTAPAPSPDRRPVCVALGPTP